MRPWWRDQRGSQIVEFALILPLLCVLVLSGPILGMAVRSWFVVEGAAREAARNVAIYHDAGKARDAACLYVTGFGRLPRQDQHATLFDCANTEFISVDAGRGSVRVSYKQPVLIPGLGVLLNGRWGDYITVSGEAVYLPEEKGVRQ